MTTRSRDSIGMIVLNCKRHALLAFLLRNIELKILTDGERMPRVLFVGKADRM